MFPTRQSLGAMKNKLKGAETGHSLLKRKSEALTKYVQTIGLVDMLLIFASSFKTLSRSASLPSRLSHSSPSLT